jgi:regulator of sigma E protease
MDILAAIWTVTVGVLLVILGFNALIIVHEWGHFIVARLCGVRCEKFYIWFDFWGLKFGKFKWGDTEYGLGLFPLGGYVKMLGQEDNPGAIQAEIERAKLQTQAATPPIDPDETVDFPPKPDTEGGTPPAPESQLAIFAPDSYLSKKVRQRLAIIVAGVVMNFLFAIVCAAGAYMLGVKESVPVVGNVIPGSPAWEAGLQPGDKIAAIDGTPARAFGDVLMKMVEGNKTIQLDIDRQGKMMAVHLSPRKQTGDHHPKIGITSLSSLELLPLKSGPVGSLWKKHYSAESLEVLGKNSETNPLRLEKVDGHVVGNHVEYQEAQLKKIGLPITCTFNGVDTEIPAMPMRTIPVRFNMGTITAVLTGSDAEKQGIKGGDTIISVDGDADIDPLKLPQILLQKVNVEQKSVGVVIRKSDGAEQTLTLELRPMRFLSELSYQSMRDSLGSAALGLSWNVEPVIAAVDESALPSGQPLPAIGDRVVGVEMVNGLSPLTKNSFSEPTNDGGYFIHDIGSKIDIPYIFTFLLQETLPCKEENILSVRLTLENADGTTKVVPLPIAESIDWFHSDRGIAFAPELTTFKAAGLGEALTLGMDKTVYCSWLIYRTLNSLINGTVSPKALMGPVGIVTLFYQVAQEPWSVYLMLLCLIGANLAVINLLPIPPLDGGHILFFTYEGIFRRQPNELVQVILSYFGLFLILLLMIWTITLDLEWIPRW